MGNKREFKENNTNEDGSYKVGKNKPPVHSRIKKGEVRNPKGPTKKLPKLEILLDELLGEDPETGLSKMKEIIEVQIKKAKKGDHRAAELLLDRGYGKVKGDFAKLLDNEGMEIKISRTVITKNISDQNNDVQQQGE